MRAPRSASSAFSLIELLIVVGIISILAAIAIPNFLEAHTRGRVARARADMNTLRTALQSYFVDNNSFLPSPFDTGVTPMYQGPQELRGANPIRLTTPTAYLSSYPTSPFLSVGPVTVPNEAGAGYHLMNYSFQVAWENAHPGTNACSFCDEYGAHKVDYALWSLGPALGDPASNYGLLYDPTNGTISRGRIVSWSDGGDHVDIYDYQ